MADSSEAGKLKARIAELELQLAEEREESEWDLKAAKETGDATVRKLNAEIEKLKQATPGKAPGGSFGKSGEVEMLSKRALMAERKVAELQEELKRASSIGPPPVPKEDSFQRQRAESAEREREDLRREKRAAERSLREKDSLVGKLQKELDEAKAIKGELESARRELADREQKLNAATQASASAGDLGAELERVKSEVKEKENRIRELAEELNNLSVVESERNDLARELGQVRAGLEQGGKKEQEQAKRVAQLESDVSRLNQELAKQGMASGQMVEHRERESQRLKSDLEELRQREAESARKLQKTQKENENLHGELSVQERERDELVAQLTHLREQEQTQVTRREEEQTLPGSDPFNEKTVKSSVPLGSASAPRVLVAQERHPASTSADDVSMPVVAGEMVRPAVEQAEEVFSEEDLSEEMKTDRALPQPNVQTAPAGRPLPEPPVFKGAAEEQAQLPESGGESLAEELEPLSVYEESDQRQNGLEGQAELEDLPDLDGSAAEAEGDFFSGPSPVASQPEVELPAQGGFTEEGQDSSVIVERDGEKPPMAKSTRVRQKTSSGLVLKIASFTLLAAVLVVGAWHFFPIWFGVGDVDGSVTPVPVAGEPDAGALPADKQPAANTVDAGSTTSAAGDAAGARDISPAEEADVGGKTALPEPSAELQKARAFGLKLLKKKKFPRAEIFIRGWVETHPEDPVFHYLYGRALFYRKHKKAAAIQLERAIEIDSQMFEAYYELGGIYLLLKKKDQACEALSAFAHLVPATDKRVAGVRSHLKKMHCP
ncbi:MAG TPA: hypothetical protein VM425_19400 [Myxococcota bacterium]|nr:hypothetical protein [Myxococcota bacterium]